VLKNHGGTTYEPAFTLGEARALGTTADPVFLGLRGGAPYFGFGLPPAVVENLQTRADLFLTDLRSVAVQGLVAPEHLPPIAEAKALLHWHARHRFCANCGHRHHRWRLATRLPVLQRAAFPAHRSGRHHADHRRR
jgi:NAD+ diphosphatase